MLQKSMNAGMVNPIMKAATAGAPNQQFQLGKPQPPMNTAGSMRPGSSSYGTPQVFNPQMMAQFNARRQQMKGNPGLSLGFGGGHNPYEAGSTAFANPAPPINVNAGMQNALAGLGRPPQSAMTGGFQGGGSMNLRKDLRDRMRF